MNLATERPSIKYYWWTLFWWDDDEQPITVRCNSYHDAYDIAGGRSYTDIVWFGPHMPR